MKIKRRIIEIDRDKCDGCGLCVNACHEGAIALVDGKARLTTEHYCDGLGDCLPACPQGAISFVEREAEAYDAAAVAAARSRSAGTADIAATTPGVPGTPDASDVQGVPGAVRSRLEQWPVQIKLAPVAAPVYRAAELLIAADCSAYTRAGFHEDFMRGRITLIGCPKLDAVDYSEKLAEMLRQGGFSSVTVVRMEVPCCGGLEYAVGRAREASGCDIPCRVVTLSVEGELLESRDI